MNNKQWPATIDEAVGVVIAALPEAEAAKIAAMPEADLINLHFGLGMWIRNKAQLSIPPQRPVSWSSGFSQHWLSLSAT